MNKKSSGSILDVLSVGICILAISIMMMAYLNSIELVNSKAEISQLARKYILNMETVGYLTPEKCQDLKQDLVQLGVGKVDLSGTTLQEVSYGNAIVLSIQGVIYGQEMQNKKGLLGMVFLKKEYPFQELRMSTAKH